MLLSKWTLPPALQSTHLSTSKAAVSLILKPRPDQLNPNNTQQPPHHSGWVSNLGTYSQAPRSAKLVCPQRGNLFFTVQFCCETETSVTHRSHSHTAKNWHVQKPVEYKSILNIWWPGRHSTLFLQVLSLGGSWYLSSSLRGCLLQMWPAGWQIAARISDHQPEQNTSSQLELLSTWWSRRLSPFTSVSS